MTQPFYYRLLVTGPDLASKLDALTNILQNDLGGVTLTTEPTHDVGPGFDRIHVHSVRVLAANAESAQQYLITLARRAFSDQNLKREVTATRILMFRLTVHVTSPSHHAGAVLQGLVQASEYAGFTMTKSMSDAGTPEFTAYLEVLHETPAAARYHVQYVVQTSISDADLTDEISLDFQ